VNRPSTASAVGGAPPAASTIGQGVPVSLGERMRGIGSAFRQMFGMPDYERYLHHAAITHPGTPVLTRREFCARMIERKYGKGPGRCC